MINESRMFQYLSEADLDKMADRGERAIQSTLRIIDDIRDFSGSAAAGDTGIMTGALPLTNRAIAEQAWREVAGEIGRDPLGVEAHEWLHSTGWIHETDIISAFEGEKISGAIATATHMQYDLAYDYGRGARTFVEDAFYWRERSDLDRAIWRYLENANPAMVNKIIGRE